MSCSSTSPGCAPPPRRRRARACRAINRALEGIAGPTVVHLCFGYAAVVKQRSPPATAFLPQLADTIAQQISIEAAQPKLDLGVLRELAGKTIVLGVLDLDDPAVETAEDGRRAHPRRGCAICAPERLDRRARLRDEIPAARDARSGKLRALAEGAAIVRRELAG